jgi:uncharacterized membrane protein YgdD (TMEM256/DUF423 family)
MNWIMIGASFALVGVAAGAFGAHGLRSRLPADLLAVFEVAVRYQMYHAFALILIGLGEARLAPGSARIAGLAFTLGILIFSGSLYALALSGVRWLGAITPLGGLAFLVGWVAFILAAVKR